MGKTIKGSYTPPPTTDKTLTKSGVAADAKAVGDSFTANFTASDGLQFKFGKDGDGNYGYYGADGSLIPFKKMVTQSVVITRTTLSMSTRQLYSTAGDITNFTGNIGWTGARTENYIQFTTDKKSLDITVKLTMQGASNYTITPSVTGADYVILNEIHATNNPLNVYQSRLTNISGTVKISLTTSYSAVVEMGIDFYY